MLVFSLSAARKGEARVGRRGLPKHFSIKMLVLIKMEIFRKFVAILTAELDRNSISKEQ